MEDPVLELEVYNRTRSDKICPKDRTSFMDGPFEKMTPDGILGHKWQKNGQNT